MKLVFPKANRSSAKVPRSSSGWCERALISSTLCAPRAPYRRASFYPLVHFFKSKPSTCTCFLPSPPLSALPRSVSIMWWQKFKKLPFVKSWRYGKFSLTNDHICRPCQWCTTPPSTSRLTRSWCVCLASSPKVIVLVVYCLKYVVAETPLLQSPHPKALWDQSDRVTLLPTKRPPLTRRMALHR